MSVFEDALIVAAGAAMVIWNRWLNKVMYRVKLMAASKDTAAQEQVALFEGILQGRVMRQVTKALPILGFVIMFYGVYQLSFG